MFGVMLFVRYVFFISLIFISEFALGAEGCVVNSQVHLTRAPTNLELSVLGSNKVFSEVSIPSNNCNVGSSLGSCSACLSGGSVINVNLIGIPVIVCSRGGLFGNYTPTPGFYYTNYIVQCNLDDYSWALGASAAALGLIVIRKRKFF